MNTGLLASILSVSSPVFVIAELAADMYAAPLRFGQVERQGWKRGEERRGEERRGEERRRE
jgi:hypothetical protein